MSLSEERTMTKINEKESAFDTDPQETEENVTLPSEQASDNNAAQTEENVVLTEPDGEQTGEQPTEPTDKEQGEDGFDDEKTPTEQKPENSEVADQEKPAPDEKVTDWAKVFGVSVDQLQTEFNRYKANKLFRKMRVDFLDNTLNKEQLVRKLGEAEDFTFGGVTLLPNAVPTAVKNNIAIPYSVALSYPYGADGYNEKKYMIKQAVKTPISGIELFFDNFSLTEKKKSALVREYKWLKWHARRRKLTVCVRLNGLTPNDMKLIAEVLSAAKIGSVKLVSEDLKKDDFILTSFLGAYKDVFNVVVSGNTDKTDEVINYLGLGVEAFSSANAVELAKNFKAMLEV